MDYRVLRQRIMDRGLYKTSRCRSGQYENLNPFDRRMWWKRGVRTSGEVRVDTAVVCMGIMGVRKVIVALGVWRSGEGVVGRRWIGR